MNIDAIKNQLSRRAIRMQIGGFRPPESPFSSWFGRVLFCAPGESWPETNGEPLAALCQLNLTELPFRPPHLLDIDFMTIFINPSRLPLDAPNGTDWCLRAYKDISGLIRLEPKDVNAGIHPFPMRPEVLETDFPSREDIPVELFSEIEELYDEFPPPHNGFKLGGWPILIQSEIFWAPENQHLIEPEYVFQIDSEPKAKWAWGGAGVGYFGRGVRDGRKDEWVCSWQCY